jgi:hypothetical protein
MSRQREIANTSLTSASIDRRKMLARGLAFWGRCRNGASILSRLAKAAAPGVGGTLVLGSQEDATNESADTAVTSTATAKEVGFQRQDAEGGCLERREL